jgi:hypothetical protein
LKKENKSLLSSFTVIQPGAGSVDVCCSLHKAILVMHMEGCCDVTPEIKDDWLRIDPSSIRECFDWEDSKGETYWHMIKGVDIL